ncbi:isoprenoid biosynthesis protein with amidotransferase-like domain [Lentisphaera araneosa HTCC2155]|uniref:Isoprenoid biosynthesis protein with amidotransferase-like domain n=1 Tax=Lentisphaera araneosa HTCC2155 TaxID=313628 RepID=A6DI61_9BACT|nr:isoprenoid biosynthesis glyoxalase ElbB [Lentisphaera araneosa]EDM28715.1 isoprenoid biosynthesis protein with amidotransferase-like domain [Lentisphaera araneosa HTCC2155]
MKIAVILAGSGVFDGSEIHEATLSLLALDQAGVEYQCIAPNIEQSANVNHLNNEALSSARNVLEESARIARGNVLDLAEAKSSDYDALLIPGGFGAALNLCDFALKGPECSVNKNLEDFILEFYQDRKAIGAMCIAPALIAKVLGKEDVLVTIGNDEGTADAIEACGAIHENCAVDSIVVDEANRVVTTPAYMLASGPAEAWSGIEKLVKKVIKF